MLCGISCLFCGPKLKINKRVGYNLCSVIGRTMFKTKGFIRSLGQLFWFWIGVLTCRRLLLMIIRIIPTFLSHWISRRVLSWTNLGALAVDLVRIKCPIFWITLILYGANTKAAISSKYKKWSCLRSNNCQLSRPAWTSCLKIRGREQTIWPKWSDTFPKRKRKKPNSWFIWKCSRNYTNNTWQATKDASENRLTSSKRSWVA